MPLVLTSLLQARGVARRHSDCAGEWIDVSFDGRRAISSFGIIWSRDAAAGRNILPFLSSNPFTTTALTMHNRHQAPPGAHGPAPVPITAVLLPMPA